MVIQRQSLVLLQQRGDLRSINSLIGITALRVGVLSAILFANNSNRATFVEKLTI